MTLPKEFTTVTPLSKYLAMMLFVLLPFVGFYLGTKYQNISSETISPVAEQKIVKITEQETKNDLIQRCGDIPSENLKPLKTGHYTVMDGPEWAPDCRHISWSLWESGTSVIDPSVVNKVSSNSAVPAYVGLYVYDDRTKQIAKIGSAKDNAVFKGWKDSNTILFDKLVDQQKQVFSYDINSHSTSVVGK